MKLDDRFDALARTRAPDLWPDISERGPHSASLTAEPSRLRRAGIALLALAVAGAGFAYALRTFDERRGPGSSPGPAIGGSYTIETVLEREGLIDVAVGEGSVWATTRESVVRLDAVSGEIQAEVPLEDGFDIAVGGGGVWVTRNHEGGIDVVHIDPATNQVVAHVPASSYCVAVGEGAVWVTANSGRDLIEIDPATDKIVATVPIDPGVDGRGAGCVAAGADGVWVTRGGDADALLRLDPQTHDVVAMIDVPNVDMADAIVVDGADVWIAVPQRWNDNGQPLVMLHRIDPAKNDVNASIPLGESSGLAAGEQGASQTRLAIGDGLIWVETGSHLFAVDPIDGDVIASFPGGGGGSIATLGLAVSDGTVWSVAAESSLLRGVIGAALSPGPSVEPAAELGVTDTTEVAEFPNAVVAGEGSIWVSAPANDGSGAGDVVRIDPVTSEIVARISVEALPTWETGGGGLAVGLGSVWVSGTLFGSGSGEPGRDDAVVTVIDPNTNDVSDVVDLGPGSGADVWVDDFDIWALVFTPDNEGLEVVRVDSVTHDVVSRVAIDGIWSQQVWAGEGAVWVNAHQPAGGSVVGASTLTKIDRVTNEVVATREGTAFVESIEPDDGLLWAWVHEGLVQIDATTLEPVGDPIEIPGGHEPFVVEGSGAWFYGYDNDADAWFVSRVSLETGMVDATGELGPDTQDNRWWLVAAALDPPTSTVWAVHYRENVSRISVS